MNPLLESIFGKNFGPRQMAIVGVGIAVTAAVIFVSRYAAQPDMVPLFAGAPASIVATMDTKLTEIGVAHTVINGANPTIMVAEADMAKARVGLAQDGLPNAGRPGMELFDKATWGMTDFTQKVNYGRALEGELERTISKTRDVEAVQVHLALEDEALFKQDARPSKASVQLTMKGGAPPQQSVVMGIASLVAGSIGGLDPQHVTVVDESGHALTVDDDGSTAGVTSRQLLVQRDIENTLQKKAEQLLVNLVGTGNSTVQVTATVNFDKLERTTQAVDPDKQATATEQKAEVTPGTPQQGAGYSTAATTYDNSRSVENFTSASGTIRKISVAVVVADKVTMPPPDTTTKAAGDSAKPKPAPEPIITPRTTEELAKIEALVRGGLGVDSTRGDMITVQSAPFHVPTPIVARDSVKPTFVDRIQQNQKPITLIGALVVLLVVGVVSILALKPKKEKALAAGTQNAQLAEGASLLELAAGPDGQGQMQQLPGQQGQASQQQLQSAQQRADLGLPPIDDDYEEETKGRIRLGKIITSPERDQAIATVEQRPEAAIRVTQNWLRA